MGGFINKSRLTYKQYRLGNILEVYHYILKDTKKDNN